MAKGKYHEWLTPEGIVLLEGWARDGLTDEQIAENMGIKRQTLYDWKNRHSDISDALKRGKEVVDRHVENALLKRALGYQYDEVTKESDKRFDPETGMLADVMVETTPFEEGEGDEREVRLADKIKALELLGKCFGMWIDKQQVDVQGAVQIVDDVPNKSPPKTE